MPGPGGRPAVHARLPEVAAGEATGLGRNLCPARDDTRRFMLDYVREMYLDFYPNADGLLVESSDYAACHCKDCGPKFFENEFTLVKAVSEAVWEKKTDATVVVYPKETVNKE